MSIFLLIMVRDLSERNQKPARQSNIDVKHEIPIRKENTNRPGADKTKQHKYQRLNANKR